MRKVVPSKSEVTLGDPLGRAEEWHEDGPLSLSYFIRYWGVAQLVQSDGLSLTGGTPR